MAFKDKLFGLIDNTGLGKVFSTPAHDPAKARKPLLTGIANTRKQYESGQTKAPNRWWKVSNGVVALTVKVGGEVMEINGVPTNHFPAERFTEFMDHFEEAVKAGEFDDELANHGKGDVRVHIAKTGKRSQQSAISDPNHPKFTDPKWSSLSSGDKIKAGLAYKNKQA